MSNQTKNFFTEFLYISNEIGNSFIKLGEFSFRQLSEITRASLKPENQRMIMRLGAAFCGLVGGTIAICFFQKKLNRLKAEKKDKPEEVIEDLNASTEEDVSTLIVDLNALTEDLTAEEVIEDINASTEDSTKRVSVAQKKWLEDLAESEKKVEEVEAKIKYLYDMTKDQKKINIKMAKDLNKIELDQAENRNDIKRTVYNVGKAEISRNFDRKKSEVCKKTNELSEKISEIKSQISKINDEISVIREKQIPKAMTRFANICSIGFIPIENFQKENLEERKDEITKRISEIKAELEKLPKFESANSNQSKALSRLIKMTNNEINKDEIAVREKLKNEKSDLEKEEIEIYEQLALIQEESLKKLAKQKENQENLKEIKELGAQAREKEKEREEKEKEIKAIEKEIEALKIGEEKEIEKLNREEEKALEDLKKDFDNNTGSFEFYNKPEPEGLFEFYNRLGLSKNENLESIENNINSENLESIENNKESDLHPNENLDSIENNINSPLNEEKNEDLEGNNGGLDEKKNQDIKENLNRSQNNNDKIIDCLTEISKPRSRSNSFSLELPIETFKNTLGVL